MRVKELLWRPYDVLAFVVTLLVLCVFIASPTTSHVSPNDPNATWYTEQFSVGDLQKGYPPKSCCDISDVHVLTDALWRMNSGRYEVRINGEWIPVEPHQIRDARRGGPNPTNHAVIWYVVDSQGRPNIYCFSPGNLY